MANKLDLAEAQIIGFIHGSKGYSLRDLIQGMGLNKTEWLKIRDHVNLSFSEKSEIDDYFNK